MKYAIFGLFLLAACETPNAATDDAADVEDLTTEPSDLETVSDLRKPRDLSAPDLRTPVRISPSLSTSQSPTWPLPQPICRPRISGFRRICGCRRI